MKGGLLLIFVFIFSSNIAQNKSVDSSSFPNSSSIPSTVTATQTIRGKIIDKDSQFALFGCMSILRSIDSTLERVATSDINGSFTFASVPIGKYNIEINYLGYVSAHLTNVVVDAGKEKIIEIELEESTVKVEAVVIKGSKKGTTNNQMSSVSAVSFDVEETGRYAGSRGDPARMASNFAGAQGGDDSRNDVVVRGNSPIGILWRIEGLDVPSPNHFSIAGTNGGPVSIVNNKMLKKSDFFTGAFPAEYGNSTAGVFDLKFRSGNKNKHEFTGQFGFLGTEITAEGPLSDSSKASYLINARYSTLALFNFLGINIGTEATPKYSDASFKLNFPLKNNANFSLFGMGGRSNIDIIVSDQDEPTSDLFAQRDRDQLFKSSLGIAGMNYAKSFSKKSLLKITVGATGTNSGSEHTKVIRDLDYKVVDTFAIRQYDINEYRVSANVSYTYKWNAKNTLRSGVNFTQYYFDMFDADYDSAATPTIHNDLKDKTGLLRAYSQWKFKPTKKLIINTGVNFQMFILNSAKSIEPRVGIKYLLGSKSSLSAAYGKHSQLQPNYLYFQEFKNAVGVTDLHNKNMGFTKSDHFVLAYDLNTSSTSRIKIEAYYQNLYNIPVYKESSSGYSMVNFGSSYRFIYPPALQNTGTAKNYGAEFTFEKSFAKSFYILTTVSLYESKYTGSDNVQRNTAFNGNFTSNFLTGKEWTFGKEKNKTFGIGTKVTYAGGKRYTPIDTLLSMQANDIVEDFDRSNEFQFANYFRLDLKLSFKLNKKNITHEFGLDIVNITGHQNVLKKTYIPATANESAQLIDEYQLGFFPIFYYKIDF